MNRFATRSEDVLDDAQKRVVFSALYESKPSLSGSAMVSCALLVLVSLAKHRDWFDVFGVLLGVGLAAWLYVRYRRQLVEWRAAMISAWTVLGPEPRARYPFMRGEP